MQDAYASLALAECPLVLNKRLRPFSLWHAHVLEAFDSPLMDGGPADVQDVIFAAWVCSRTHAESSDWLRNRRADIADDCKAWGATVTPESVTAAGETIREYIRNHTRTVYRHGHKAEESAAQWTLVYLAFICGGRLDGETVARAWDTPINLAYALSVTAQISAGDETFFTESMEAGLQAARQAVKLEEGTVDNGNG